MSQIDRIKAFKAVLQDAGATEFTFPMTTKEAVVLAGELDDSVLAHAAQVRSAVDLMANFPKAPDQDELKFEYYKKLGEVAMDFWDGFQGTVVEGVTVIRRK